MAKSEWSYKSAVELAAALAAKKVSAVELMQDAIGRIERHDGKVNAICVRDFDRALSAAREADAALGPRRAQAAARPADDGEGILQHRRSGDDLGHPSKRTSLPRKTRCRSPGSRMPAPSFSARPTCRSARRLAELQRHLRHHQQPLRSRPDAGRLLRRLLGGARRGLRPALDRLRHRRLAARAGVPLRRLRAQTDLHPVPPRPHGPPLPPLPMTATSR